MKRRQDGSIPAALSSPAYVDPVTGHRWMSEEAWAHGRAMWDAGLTESWDAGFAAPDEPWDEDAI